MFLTLSGRSFFKIHYSSFPLFPVAHLFRIPTQLQYYVKREKRKVNDVIFPSGCEARAINLGNRNIFVLTGHVLRRLDMSNMTHHRPLDRGKYYTLISSAQWRKNGYYH